MPEKGERVRGKDIGRPDGYYLYDICIDCEEGEWIPKQRYGLRTSFKPGRIKNQKKTFIRKY